MKQAPVTISFPATTSKRFRLLFTQVTAGHRNFVPSKNAALAEINLSDAARLPAAYAEIKQRSTQPTGR